MNTRLENLLNVGGFILATAGAADMLAPRAEYGGWSKYYMAVSHLFHPKEEAVQYGRGMIPGVLCSLTGVGMIAIAGFAPYMRKREDEKGEGNQDPKNQDHKYGYERHPSPTKVKGVFLSSAEIMQMPQVENFEDWLKREPFDGRYIHPAEDVRTKKPTIH